MSDGNPIHSPKTMMIPYGYYHSGGDGAPKWRDVGAVVYDYGFPGASGRRTFTNYDAAKAYKNWLDDWYRGET